MVNKPFMTIIILALVALLFFVGATITGFIVHKVDYEDICKTDSDCPVNQCCLMHKGIGLCMEHCQSIEFLCQEDAECEEGTVCCISEGMEYGLCNSADKCMSMDLFVEYMEKSSMLEKPAPLDTKWALMMIGIILIVLLLIIIVRPSFKPEGSKK